MIEFLAPISARVARLWTDYTTARAVKIDHLDGDISAITPIRSVQRGTITIANGSSSNTATISAVTTGKTSMKLLGSRCGSTVVTFTDALAEVDLTNSTTVTASRNGATGSLTVRYECTEYK